MKSHVTRPKTLSSLDHHCNYCTLLLMQLPDEHRENDGLVMFWVGNLIARI